MPLSCVALLSQAYARTHVEVPVGAGGDGRVDAAQVLLAPVDEGGVHGQELVGVVQAPLWVWRAVYVKESVSEADPFLTALSPSQQLASKSQSARPTDSQPHHPSR